MAGQSGRPLLVSTYSVCPWPPSARASTPASVSELSRSDSTARGMFRWAAKSPNRRTPKKLSRRISSVQRSPTISSARASEHCCPA